ncbi:hypothetical protein DFH08DRAFT_853924 [Mycena albidolilacea]|uniref:Uncharacterized protein n=1 Tax=Mycena albidolilacea TaxID=1033008 RepID=A0AAD7ADS2_9AGAR|nr:hypothetical protein DFH08DRAFT_853924 [Mycena albidolilacea]
MTEYTTSSQAIRDYLSSKERTKHWVRSRVEPPDQCYSPNIAPSVLNEPDFVLPPPSDAGSTHSVPPKMVLRYTDGRPDQPIYQDPNGPPLNRGGSKLRPHDSLRSQTLPTSHRSRSGSQSAPRVPEEIRILPSHAVDAPRSAAHSHARSKSLPRNAYSQLQEPEPELPPPHSSHHGSHHGHPAGGAGLPGPLPLPRGGPLVTFTQPPPQTWHNSASHGRHHAPPPIVYAPSHRSRPHYAPPAIYTHPPNMGPNGMIYSHSAPVPPSHYPPKYPTPYPSAHMSSVHEERGSGSRTPHRRDRSQSRSGTARPSSPTSSISSFASNDSGSTYYVMPTGRQKVHVIHTPDTSHTASSTSHSPTSPHSRSSLKKPPLFQRLLGFAEKRLFSSSGDSSRGSSRGGRRLHRRHSTGGSGRSRSTPPGE